MIIHLLLLTFKKPPTFRRGASLRKGQSGVPVDSTRLAKMDHAVKELEGGFNRFAIDYEGRFIKKPRVASRTPEFFQHSRGPNSRS